MPKQLSIFVMSAHMWLGQVQQEAGPLQEAGQGAWPGGQEKKGHKVRQKVVFTQQQQGSARPTRWPTD